MRMSYYVFARFGRCFEWRQCLECLMSGSGGLMAAEFFSALRFSRSLQEHCSQKGITRDEIAERLLAHFQTAGPDRRRRSNSLSNLKKTVDRWFDEDVVPQRAIRIPLANAIEADPAVVQRWCVVSGGVGKPSKR